MANWSYEGRTRTGELRKGSVEAPSHDAAMSKVRGMQLTPIRVRKALRFSEITIGSPVTIKDLVIFTRQFATMIDAGLPLVQGLEILATQSDDPVMQKALFQVKTDVESGSTFAAALEKHPKIFDTLYVSLVAAGELGGILDTILDRLAGYIEKAASLKKRVKGALTYPVAILFISIGVIIGLMVWVIPVFAKIFRDLGSNLPAPTLLIMQISDFFVQYFMVIIISLVSAVVIIRTLFKTPRTRYFIDMIALKVPMIGSTITKVAVARFCRTLGTMISSGIPILQAMEVVEKTAGNMIIEKAIGKVREKITEGKNMAEPLMEAGVFPSMVVQMIAVGESTGALDAMLSKIADFYDEEVDSAVDALTSMLEPMMMVFLGALVGWVLIAMYLPIFSMSAGI